MRSGGSGQGPLGMCIPELNALNINGIVNVPFGVKFNVRLLSIIISVDFGENLNIFRTVVYWPSVLS